jgi:hypothetical protein
MDLTPDQAQYFDDMNEMFMTPGWKTFIEDMQLRRDDLIKASLRFASHESFLIAKGRMQTFDTVLEFEQMADSLKKSIEEADLDA